VISLAAIWVTLDFLASIVSFGALVAFSAVNLTVIKHYFVDEGEKNVFNNLILPAIGFVLTAWLWTSLSSLTLEVGLIWLAVGLIWLLVVTRTFTRPTPVLAIEE
jgi:amino acid transporter